MVGRTLTAILWGVIADRYGRKPVMLISTLGMSVPTWFLLPFLSPLPPKVACTKIGLFPLLSVALQLFSDTTLCLMCFYGRVIFNTLFGLSTNYWMAMATRFCIGALCGILGPIRVSQQELCCVIREMYSVEFHFYCLCCIDFEEWIIIVLGPLRLKGSLRENFLSCHYNQLWPKCPIAILLLLFPVFAPQGVGLD